MTNITIPPEAVEAAARALHSQWIDNNCSPSDRHEYREWDSLISIEREDIVKEATAAIRAALAAWPGVVKNYSWDASHGRIILPLPQENGDG